MTPELLNLLVEELPFSFCWFGGINMSWQNTMGCTTAHEVVTWAIPACSCVLDSPFLYVRRRFISLIHGMGLCRGRRTLLAEIKQSHRAGSEADSVTWQLQSLLWKKENSCLSEAFPLDHLCLFQSDSSVVKCTIAKNRCKMYIAHSLRPCTREILF